MNNEILIHHIKMQSSIFAAMRYATMKLEN